MTTETTSTASKLAIIFGIGATLTAVYSKGRVVYSNDKAKLEIDTTGQETEKAIGTYNVTIKESGEVEEVFVEPPKAEAKPEGKAEKPTARQSPSFSFAERQPREYRG